MVTILTQQNLQSEDVQAVENLDHQLNPDQDSVALAEVLSSNSTFLFVYRQQQQIVGMATLTRYQVISGYKGWIEDVVVDRDHRGKGIGKKLMQAILEKAASLQLQKLFLYTEDEKQAAIHLYEQLDFTLKNSHLYSLDL